MLEYINVFAECDSKFCSSILYGMKRNIFLCWFCWKWQKILRQKCVVKKRKQNKLIHFITVLIIKLKIFEVMKHFFNYFNGKHLHSLWKSLKETVSRGFLLQVFSWIIIPNPPKITLGSFQIFLKILGDICKWRSTTSINNSGKFCLWYPWCCWHRWQILGTISNCWHLKVILKEKLYLYDISTTQRCFKKIIKTFLIEDFFHLPPVSTAPVVHLELRKFSKNLKRP